MTDLQLDHIEHADALTYLRTLPDGCVNCVVTSPPYFGLRNYQVDGQIGLEPTPGEYVAALVAVFREVRRVLRSDGVVWLNLGDSYVGYKGANYSKNGVRGTGETSHVPAQHNIGTPHTSGLREKQLMGIPWRVAFGLQDDGWILRSDVIWAKPNPMPESVTDRPARAHEYIFLLAKQPKYWYDAAAVAEEAVGGGGGDFIADYETVQPKHGGVSRTGKWARNGNGRAAVQTRNRRTVWTITEPTFRLRSDLTPEQRAYVLQRIADEGLR